MHRGLLCGWLEEEGYQVMTFESGESCLRNLDQNPSAICLDLIMPEMAGIETLKRINLINREITKAWTGMTTREYKKLKSLKKENLRDNMTNLELVLNMLAETATTEISDKREPKSFDENKTVARERKGEALRAMPEKILKPKQKKA